MKNINYELEKMKKYILIRSKYQFDIYTFYPETKEEKIII